jgi:NADPH-dependent 7-cyano-7-deazaguanine reductase QueF
MADGPCACGASHNVKEWLVKLTKYLADSQAQAAKLESTEGKTTIDSFNSMCERSINPDLYSVLIDEIIPALELARKG